MHASVGMFAYLVSARDIIRMDIIGHAFLARGNTLKRRGAVSMRVVDVEGTRSTQSRMEGNRLLVTGQCARVYDCRVIRISEHDSAMQNSSQQSLK